MSSEGLISHFRCVEIFQGLAPAQVAEIARHAERMVYKPGKRLIEKDAAGDSAILVVTGKALVTAGPGVHPATPVAVEPGSLLGEMAMLIETGHTATVVAETEVRALKINRRDLLAQMHDDPGVAEHFVAKIAERLQKVAGELKRIDDMLLATAAPPVTARGPKPGLAAPAG